MDIQIIWNLDHFFFFFNSLRLLIVLHWIYMETSLSKPIVVIIWRHFQTTSDLCEPADNSYLW